MFCDNLRRLRIERGFPRARHLAQALGINENRYTRYERGEAEPPIALIYRMCVALGVTPNELFGLEGAPGAMWPEPSPGFSECAGDEAVGTACGVPARGGLTHVDRSAIWRLARAATRARRSHGPATELDALAQLREVTAVVGALEVDPYAAIKALMSSPELAAMPPSQRSRLAAEIDGFLAVVLGDQAASGQLAQQA